MRLTGLALALPFLQVSLAATYTISHRLLAPSSAPNVEFQKYGTISVSDESSIGARIDRSEGSGAGIGGAEAVSGEWYQVIVSGEGLGEGIMSSTKACYLNAGSPSIVLHRHDRRLSGIEIVPHASIPSDGSCPPASASVSNLHLASEILIKEPHQIFGPDLAPPIPVSTAPGGGPVQPVEEKTFLQKYWLPLIGVAFFVVSQLAPDDKTAAPAAKA